MILDQYGNPYEIERKVLTTEFATYTAATGSSTEILPDPDPVLRKRGDDAKVLEAVAADDQVTMAMQLRKRKVTNKGNYDYSPGQPEKGVSPTKRSMGLCKEITVDLAGIKLKNTFNSALSANFWGYSVVELYWRVDGSRLKLVGMEEKPREWFGFSEGGKLFFYENGQKKEVPWGKFLVVRHEPTYKNPYGLRLLSRCLWPVAFKKAGIEWCNRFLQKYGIPWQVAKVPQNYTEKQRIDLAGQLAAMVQDAVMILPHGSEHDIAGVDSKGGGEAFLSFLHFWNATISKVLSCQTQSSETSGKTGTYASSKTHYDVLEDVTTADEMLVCDAMNDLGFIYTQLNAPGEYPPVFSFIEAEDHLAQADLDKKRYAVGVRFTKAHFERQGLDPDEFELAKDAAAGPSKPGKKAEFAAPRFTADQQAIENLADQSISDAVQGIEGFQEGLVGCVEEAEGFDDLIRRLQEAFPKASAGEFEDMLSQAMVAAEMFGRHQVIQEGGS